MTDHYAIIGNPVAHSKSPEIHAAFAHQTGQDIDYVRILAPLDGFASAVMQFRREGGCGVNVTLPFKFEACQFATQLTERAQVAQAVNTLKFNDDQILGDNTDGAGLVADVQQNLGLALRGKRVLLMGAGGAAYGVALPLLQAGAVLTIVNRNVSKAEQLASTLSQRVASSTYQALGNSQFDVVINATSSGLSDELPPLPQGIFAPGSLAYDMMYGRETPFMRFGREQGAARVADGLGMLVEQAAEAFLLWRGIRPDTAPVITQLRAV